MDFGDINGDWVSYERGVDYAQVEATLVGYAQVEAKSRELLLKCLQPQERQDFIKNGRLSVLGPSGHRYVLLDPYQNLDCVVLVYDNSNTLIDSLCIIPEVPGFPDYDVLLAQILLLKTDEGLFISTAFSVSEIPF